MEQTRHGRAPRNDARGIRALRRGGRNTFFIDSAKELINYLCDVQPELMNGVRVDMALLPFGDLADGKTRLWSVLPGEKRVILYRVPVERLAKLHRVDAWHKRNNIETVIIEAIAELLEVDPYDFAPNRYFPHG